MAEQQPNINVKITDETLKGVYANNVQISFTQEEFIVDFMNLFPPQGIVNSRVLLNPAHMKRVSAVLSNSIKEYEQKFGEVKSAAPGQPAKTSESTQFGF